MELRSNKPLEETKKPTEKPRKSSPPKWQLEKYIFKEPIDDKMSSHCDPRQEYVEQTHGQHPDNDFIPYDDDYGYGPPVFGIGATPDLHARASDQGTLAGGACFSRQTERQQQQSQQRQQQQLWPFWNQFYQDGKLRS
jgi:hypothetical protein